MRKAGWIVSMIWLQYAYVVTLHQETGPALPVLCKRVASHRDHRDGLVLQSHRICNVISQRQVALSGVASSVVLRLDPLCSV